MSWTTAQLETVRALSDELVSIQQPIRILNSITWDDHIEAAFVDGGASSQPGVDRAYYVERRPLGFDPDDLRDALTSLESKVARQLGSSAVAALIQARIADYGRVVDMLDARGTPAFATIAAELYGSTTDELHADGPTLAELGDLMHESLGNIETGRWEPPEDPEHSAQEGVEILERRLSDLCGAGQVRVVIDDGIVADAAAGGDYIKLRADARFSSRDLRVLEVHEGWVHVVTTINGRRQPWCTFLGKGTPSTTITQEGLAVFTEVTTLSSTPERLRKITRRMKAIGMAQDGATFLDVYRWFVDEGLQHSSAWSSAVRVFRGSLPTGGPFTKDLVYSRGFLEVYDAARLAVRRGLLDRVPLLFVGKIAVRELGLLAQLQEEGVVVAPPTLPPHVEDITSLASWLAFSNLLNRIDLASMELELSAAFA